MKFEEDELEAAMHLLWHYGQEGGRQPGSFHEALIRAFEKADVWNRAKLLGAFPAFRKPISILLERGSSALSDEVRAVLSDQARRNNER